MSSDRVVYGDVRANGDIQRGTGFSVTMGSDSVYTITFAKAFASAPTVIASIRQDNEWYSGADSATLWGVGKQSCKIQTREADAVTASNRDFSFIAVGPLD